MKFKTKIVPENNGYVGFVLLGEDVVHTTNNHNDPNLVAQELGSYISSAALQPVITTPHRPMKTFVQTPIADNTVPINSSNFSSNPPPANVVNKPIINQTAPRKCCGRR